MIVVHKEIQYRIVKSGGQGPSGSVEIFPDTLPVVKDATDATKLLRFELDALSTGTTRVVTIPDSDVDLGLLGPHVLATEEVHGLGAGSAVVGTTDIQLLENKILGTGTAIDLGSDAEGDIYYRNLAGDVARLPIGATDEVLSVVAGVPDWVPSSAPDGTSTLSLELDEDISALTPVTINSSGKVVPANRSITSEILEKDKLFLHYKFGVDHCISTTYDHTVGKTLVLYSDGTYLCYTWAYYNQDQLLFTDEVVTAIQSNELMGVEKDASGVYLVVYHNTSSTNTEVVAADVTAEVLSFGTAVTLVAATAITWEKSIAFDQNVSNFVINYYATNQYVVVANVASKVITLGTPVQVGVGGNDLVQTLFYSPIALKTYVLGESVANTLSVYPLSITGTTVTLDTPTDIVTLSSLGYVHADYDLENDVAIVQYEDISTTDILHHIPLKLSATPSVTVGTSATVFTGTGSIFKHTLFFNKFSNKVITFFRDGNDEDFKKLESVYDISTNSMILVQAAEVFSTTEKDEPSVIDLNSSHIGIMYVNGNGGGGTVYGLLNTLAGTNGIIGLLQATGVKTDVVTIAYPGTISEGHTGLSAGEIYYMSATNGQISTIENEIPIGIAISATKLLVNPAITKSTPLEFADIETKIANNIQQSDDVIWEGETLNATPVELYLNGIGFERKTIQLNSAIAFEILVVAKDSAGNSAGYTITGLIENISGTTALVGAAPTIPIAEDVAGWDVAATADDINDALILTATGDTTNRTVWSAKARLVEI